MPADSKICTASPYLSCSSLSNTAQTSSLSSKELRGRLQSRTTPISFANSSELCAIVIGVPVPGRHSIDTKAYVQKFFDRNEVSRFCVSLFTKQHKTDFSVPFRSPPLYLARSAIRHFKKTRAVRLQDHRSALLRTDPADIPVQRCLPFASEYPSAEIFP